MVTRFRWVTAALLLALTSICWSEDTAKADGPKTEPPKAEETKTATTPPAAPAAAPAAETKGPRDSTLEERVADIESLLGNSTAPTLKDDKGVERKGAFAVSTGDNAWMLVSSALVLMMTGPGLALFYGGLVRRKNVLSTFMHSMFLMALISVMWAVYGYSIAFGEGSPYYGSPTQYLFLKGVGGDPNTDYAGTIPHQTFMLFQLMFAIITPALISGAFAERVKFSAMVVFTILWSTFVYFPLAHMVWGKGGMFNWFFDAKVPALDFAGGTVVHISSGVSALVFCIVLGKRIGYPKTAMPPHNLVLSMIGAGLLWVGWFGFNAGSALNAGTLASQAFSTTHFATAAAGLGWALIEWVVKGKPSALGTISGMVAGLVAITPAAGFVTVPSALIIGFIVSVGCFLACAKLKPMLGYDDALDTFGVHGVGGTIGAICTGIFATATANPAITTVFKGADGKPISLEGPGQVKNQIIAVAITWVFAAVATFVFLKIIDVTIGLRPTPEQETEGLDTACHGEEAYTSAA